MLTVKILALSVIFILTGGAVFSSFFKENKLLIILASIIALISTYYLLKDIYNDVTQSSRQGVINEINNQLGDSAKTPPVERLLMEHGLIEDERTLIEKIEDKLRKEQETQK